MGRKRIKYEDLDIREDGTIWYNGMIKKFYNHSTGYLATKFSGKAHLVHRIVAEKYLPNPENKRTVNHINGIKSDNRVSNLEWNTNKENIKHAFETGLSDSKHLRKLTMDEVREIRSKYIPYKYTQCMLGKEYGICNQGISQIINNKRYKETVEVLC